MSGLATVTKPPTHFPMSLLQTPDIRARMTLVQGRVRALVADHPRRRWWTQQRRATSSSASRCRYDYGNDDGRLHQGKGSARALHPAAGPALYKTGPVDCHRVPTSAPPGRKDGFTSTTMWRMFAARTGGPRALARSRRRARAAATSRVTGPVLAASSTSEMHCRSQWSRSGLSECIHVAVVGHHLMPV